MIAFANFCSAKEISGVSTWFERLVLHLHHLGTPVSVLLHGIGKDAQDSPVLRSLRDAGVPTVFAMKPKFSEDATKETLRFLNDYRPHVFVPQCLEHFFYAANFSAQAGLPWVFTIHSDDPVYWAASKMVDLQHPLTQTVGVSGHICKLARQQGIRQVSQIPYGVAIGEAKASFRSDRFRVAFCGRLIEEQKRISLVMETMAIACELAPNIECCVLGDGPQRERCVQMIEARQLSGRVEFYGRLEAEQIDRELLVCQAVLLMSEYEGLPVALLEAMARGVVPVVRCIPSGVPELVDHERTGLLTDADSTNAAMQLVRLSCDESLWNKCSTAAKQRVADSYNEQVCFSKWKSLLCGLVEQASVIYPLKLNSPLNLPPVPPVLSGRDIRRVSLFDRVQRKFQKVFLTHKLPDSDS